MAKSFPSIKDWKAYCYGASSGYLKSSRFRQWVRKKSICFHNLCGIRERKITHLKLGIKDALKDAGLNFNLIEDDENFIDVYGKNEISAEDFLLRFLKKRAAKKGERASVFVLGAPIRTNDSVIKDGEALTYVSEGLVLFSFDPKTNYPASFLKHRGKHEALHLLGLNSHHDSTKVKGYSNSCRCVMEYNAPTQNLCTKCKTALVWFWKGIEDASKKKPLF